MVTYRIAAIRGDGVGKEVVTAGRRVLDHVADRSGGPFAVHWTAFPWGSDDSADHGRMMAADGLAVLRGFDAILGAADFLHAPRERGTPFVVSTAADFAALPARPHLSVPSIAEVLHLL